VECFLRLRAPMLAHLALAIAPIVASAATPTPHTITAMAPVEVWARGLGDLRGIAVDGEGRVWVTDHARGRVLRLDGPGAARVVASGLRGPIGIALDETGRVLVVEEDAGRVVHVTAQGTLGVVASGLERPRWLAVGDDGTIYISAKRAANEHGNDDGRPGVVLALRAAARPALLLHGLRDPEGLAIHEGVLYVATRGRQPGDHDPIVHVPLTDAGHPAGEHADTTLRKPIGLAIDGGGTIFATAHRLSVTDEHVTDVIARLDRDATADLFASGAEDPQGLAFDRDGNLYLAESKAGRVVRFVAPRPPVLAPPPLWTNAPTVTLPGHAEVNARVEAVAGETTLHTFAGGSGAFTLSLPLAPNTVNHISVRTVGHDGAGLASPPVALAIVQDASPPALALEAPPSGAILRSDVTVRASAADAGSQLSGVELLVAGQPLTTSVAPALPAPLATASAVWNSTAGADGIHTLTARATDRAGNVITVTRTITVDNTPPVTEIAGPETTAGGLRFTFAGSDNLTPPGELEFAWRVDGGAWSAFSRATTATITDPAPGPHRIEATARDRAGNEGTSPAVLTFAVAGGGLTVTIFEPAAGSTLPAGTVLVRGTVDLGGAEVGVTVNGLPGWMEGTTFIALAEVDPDSTSIVASAVAADGRTGSASIPITVTAAPIIGLLASPWSGVAPLTVHFSLSRDPNTVSVELDADGDGVLDFIGEALEEQPVTYTRPGIYVARAVARDAGGAATTATAVVRVFDAAALDSHLRAQWSAMRDALRRGDVAAGVSHIVQRRRADYDAAFRLLNASLPAIDALLTDITPLEVRNASAIYEMLRADDGLLKSFEIRFAIDGDGIWRVEAF